MSASNSDFRNQVKEFCVKELLVPFEGTGPMDKKGNFLAYKDAVGVVTIAWGITTDESNKPISMGAVWSEDRARKRKEAILDDSLNRLLQASPVLENQPIKRVAAVLSWVYNLGIGNYLKSTFKKKIDIQAWGYRDWETDRKSTRLNSSHSAKSRMPSSA